MTAAVALLENLVAVIQSVKLHFFFAAGFSLTAGMSDGVGNNEEISYSGIYFNLWLIVGVEMKLVCTSTEGCITMTWMPENLHRYLK